MSAGIFVSPKERTGRVPRLVRSLLGLSDACWSRCVDSRAIAYVFFAVVYILPNIVIARHKLIWDDEFFTVYLANTANWSELWRALSTGADQHPPSFYFLTHLIFKVAGPSHVTLRLTGLIGFGLFCVCLYEIARRIVGRRWAIPALLLPLTSPALFYATEGRGYGLELGFVSLSLWMWILAAEGRKRAWAVPTLAVGLCLAVAAHYYAVLFLVPLALGELVKMKRRRSIDVPVCCAFLGSTIPLLLFAPLLLKAREYSSHFWAVPDWSSMLLWYPRMTGGMPLVLLAASAVIFILRIPASDDAQDTAPEVQAPVAIAVVASALLPVLGVTVAQFITHAFADRYAIAALPGTVILLLWGLKRMVKGYSAGPAIASLLCLVLFAQHWRGWRKEQTSELRQARSAAALLRKVGDVPIAVSDVTVFHRLSFYGRRDLANRLVYIADPHRSVRYLGHDTIDRGLLDLAPWFPLKVVWWREWWSDHAFSLVYGGVHEWTWLNFALPEVGAAELVERDLSRLLVAVTRTRVPEDNRVAGDPSGKPMLYDQLRTNGISLCEVYLPGGACPAVDEPNAGPILISYPDLLAQR